MISSLTGKLRRVDDDRVQLEIGPLGVELLVTAADLTELQASLGEELMLHTIFYLSGDPSRGGLEPTLIGFLRPHDKQFFEAFTTVKGIGPRKALKALTCSVGDIAGAIEGKDTRFLSGLSGIGKRMAEQIVAELGGKVGKFATVAGLPAGKGGTPGPSRRPTFEEDAILALCAMGERRHEAEHFLERAKQQSPNLKTANELLRVMLQMRTVRA